MDSTGLSQTAINVAVGALVLTLTQATKKLIPEGWGPIVAALWTTLALGVWLVSRTDWPPSRTSSFEILSVWVSVYTTALGLYSAATKPTGDKQTAGSGDSNVPIGETRPAAKTRKPSRNPRRSKTTHNPPEASGATTEPPAAITGHIQMSRTRTGG